MISIFIFTKSANHLLKSQFLFDMIAIKADCDKGQKRNVMTMPDTSRKDFQKKVLEQFIMSYKHSTFNEDEINNYIQAFSAYLSKKDSAYYYNYSFLVQQNCDFVEFLNRVVAKEKVLVDFFTRLKRLPQLRPMLGPGGGMELSLNNFWTIDTQSGICSLVEDFSIDGAVCGDSGDTIMVRYGDSTFSFSPAVDDKYLEQIAEALHNAACRMGGSL